ncbi:MAG TPA: acyloxyacyl hydrolase [Candidatus Binatia bacterium]|nr:acyloxyacyl hydrolase [Candidatus Binatia bacterium]
MRRPDLRFLAALMVACLLPSFVPPATAGAIESGPFIPIGYSPDEDANEERMDMVATGLGWRWRFDGYDAVDRLFERARIDFSGAVEPLAMLLSVEDQKAFEASVVPYFQLRVAGWDRISPYFEGGIGLIYTTLSGYGLGSPVNFSDNAGIGIAFGRESSVQWSIGYRFRHISNLGLWSDHNDGMNMHFLVVAVDL